MTGREGSASRPHTTLRQSTPTGRPAVSCPDGILVHAVSLRDRLRCLSQLTMIDVSLWLWTAEV